MRAVLGFLASPPLHVRGTLNRTNQRLVYRIPYNRTGQGVRFITILPAQEIKVTTDSRVRLSQIWVPTGGIAINSDEDSHAKLVRAGFLRQAHSGVFHMLPLGRRVQDKLEALIDKYMSQLGASKLALSSISSEELWSKSGRLNSIGSELFRFRDRKDTRYLLSPTHEEEITSLVANTVTSYRELPVRLYQISRKYRDELRPRHGLLRSREFVMKDLYTFDYGPSLALATYHQVRGAYARLFNELKLPYLIAEADSGDMGGNLSHEFHFPTAKGEDHIMNCNTCDYVANEELAECAAPLVPANASMALVDGDQDLQLGGLQVWRGTSRDRSTLLNAWYPSGSTQTSSVASAKPEINVNAVKALFPELDASIQDPLPLWDEQESSACGLSEARPSISYPKRLVNLVDCRLSASIRASIVSGDPRLPYWPHSFQGHVSDCEVETLVQDPSTHNPLNLVRITTGDSCPRCATGSLEVRRAIELGHTFHLGTRYSGPLNATVTVPSHLSEGQDLEAEGAHKSDQNREVPLQMGCHGIGVTRMIGAVAETLADDKGLNWPRVMAPFEVVVIPGKGHEEAALVVYDALTVSEYDPRITGAPGLDLVIDDRKHSFPWKMRDADLIGYPVIVVVGRRWVAEKMIEIQCRRLEVRQDLHITKASEFISSLLLKL